MLWRRPVKMGLTQPSTGEILFQGPQKPKEVLNPASGMRRSFARMVGVLLYIDRLLALSSAINFIVTLALALCECRLELLTDSD